MPLLVRDAPGGTGFLSRLMLPLGPAHDARQVRGYPIDFRVKAGSLRWPPDGMDGPGDRLVVAAQYGLGCYERYLAGEGDEWLEGALRVGRYLVAAPHTDGGWSNLRDFTHTFPLRAPWRSAMAQGEAASLLVRLHQQTGEPGFAQAARDGLRPLFVSRRAGGLSASLGGHPWPEEYPTDPPSFVLNGAIFAWWGVRDVAVGLGDACAAERFADGIASLAANLERFDTGSWSLYCLYPFPVAVVASPFYHSLHIT